MKLTKKIQLNRTKIALGLLIGGGFLLGTLLITNKVANKTPSTQEPAPGRESGSLTVPPATLAETLRQDTRKLKTLTQKGPIETSRFRLEFDPELDAFVVELYTGNRESEIQHVYEQLRKLGIKAPENLPFHFIGPFNYEDYEPLPQEFIEEMNRLYENQ